MGFMLHISLSVPFVSWSGTNAQRIDALKKKQKKNLDGY